jgi:hypothetical protein
MLNSAEVENILKIDRSKSFNPTKFIGEDMIIEDEDERSLALTEIDLTAVRFETMLKKGEVSIDGEEKFRRLLRVSGHIRLDARIFQTLWENQHMIPASWKEKTNGSLTFIYFDGTVFRSVLEDDRCALFLFWDDGQWDWRYNWLDGERNANNPSAVLAK